MYPNAPVKPDSIAVFNALKTILQRHAEDLVVVVDSAENYHLDTGFIMKNKKPMFFGAVKARKHDISLHLMPVYVFPELLSDLSPELKSRMHGKSCFNFDAVTKIPIEELCHLSELGFSRYQQAGYL